MPPAVEVPRVSLVDNVELPPGFPTSYTVVSKVGSGAYAHAFFCLPKDEVSTTASANPDPLGSTMPLLASKLQIVKIINRVNLDGLVEELAVHRQIQQHQTATPEDHPFFHIVTWDTVHPICKWMAMTTLPICCTLADLQGSVPALPEEFIWMVFLEIYKAIDFLQRVCDPPVAHEDLHPGNIIVGFAGLDPTDRVQIKVIDFGLAVPYWANSGVDDTDHVDLMIDMDRLIHDTDRHDPSECQKYVEAREPAQRSDPLIDFHEQLSELLDNGEGMLGVQKLWARFGKWAEYRAGQASPETLAAIQSAVVNATGGRHAVIERRLQEM
jgi:serine/threonine protein kinase